MVFFIFVFSPVLSLGMMQAREVWTCMGVSVKVRLAWEVQAAEVEYPPPHRSTAPHQSDGLLSARSKEGMSRA